MTVSTPVRLVGCDEPGPSDPVRITNLSEVNLAMGSSKVITVGAENSDFTTIKSALASITDNGPTNPYTILVSPGIYTEDNPIAMKSYVTVEAVGDIASVVVIAQNANAHLFTSKDAGFLIGMSLSGVSGAGFYSISVQNADRIVIKDCFFLNTGAGVHCNHISANVDLMRCSWAMQAGTMTVGVLNNAGTVIARAPRIATFGAGVVTTAFSDDGANAETTIDGCIFVTGTVTTFYSGKNSCNSYTYNSLLLGANDCFVGESGADIRIFNTLCDSSGNDVVRINNVGSGTNIGTYGVVGKDTIGFDVNILSATGMISGWGDIELTKLNLAAGAEFYGTFTSLTENDEGVNALGELHVGLPEVPAEFVSGGGDSYTRGMLVYTFNPSGSVWTDVSVAARSASGSTFTFPAVAINNAVYVASSLEDGTDVLQHFGIKTSQTVAAALGGGAILVEYWDGGAWVAINHMSSLADAPYTQYAKAIFERTGNEQIRYPQAFLSGWTKNDPMSLGTSYYWIRYRISSGITTAPVFEQFKLHTNRFEINVDGVSEYFGAGRYPRDLPVHLALNSPVTGSAPANSAIAFSSATTLTLTRNQFSNNQIHSFGEILTIPVGMDTSIPLTLEVGWYPDTNGAGDIELRTFFAQLAFGDLWNGTKAESSVSTIETVAINNQFVSRVSTLDLDVSDLIPGGLLVFRVERDATGGNDPPDTLAGDIVIGSVRMFGTFWRP